MPIFPQYGGVSTGIPLQNLGGIAAPVDETGTRVAQLGKTTERVGGVLAEAARKRKELEDESMVMQRYMTAVTDMEGIHETLNVPANALQAKTLFDKGYAEREPKWFEGLSPEASFSLQKKLFSRTLEYRVGASKIENRAKMQQFDATMVAAQTDYANVAARRIEPDDGAKTPEYLNFAEMVDTGVAVGFMTPKEGAEKKAAALTQGAYSRAYKVTASDSQEEVNHLLDLFKKETAEPGSTFLKHLEPDKRTSLNKMAEERLNHLRAETVRQQNEARKATKEMNDDLSKATATMAEQKLQNPAKYGSLTREWVELAGDLRLLDHTELAHYRTQVEKQAASGTETGYGNPAVLNRFSTEVFTTTTPEEAVRVQRDLKAAIARGDVPAGPGSIGSQWLNHLEEKVAKAVGGDLTNKEKTNKVRSLVHEALRVTGPLQNVNPQAQSVLTEALETLDKNEMNGYPTDPWDLYTSKVDGWQARVGIPARMRANELRRSMGLPPAAKTLTDNVETIEKRRIELQEQFRAAPPGPDGDALRSAIRDNARALKRLHDLEQEINKYGELRGQSKAAPPSQEKPGSSSAPLTGPRR